MDNEKKHHEAGMNAVLAYRQEQIRLLTAYLANQKPVLGPRSFLLPAVMTLQ